MRDEEGRFVGFLVPRYTPVPDEIFDELLSELSGAELKVLLYIVRRTFGFKRDSDNISLNQMLNGIRKKSGQQLDTGAGLSKPTLLKALRDLIGRNIIIATQRGSKEKGNESTNYRLNVIGHLNGDGSGQDGDSEEGGEGPPLVKKLNQGGLNNFTKPLVKKFDQALVKKPTTQQTVDKNNVNVNEIKHFFKEEEEEEEGERHETTRQNLLVRDMLEVLRDHESKGFYCHIAATCPEELIRRALSETKEVARAGTIRKSKGAFFTDLIKRYAEQMGVDLRLKASS